MAKETVQIVFSADTQQARALFQELATGQNKLGQETEKTNSRLSASDKALNSLVGRWFSVAAAVNVATQAITRHNAEIDKAAGRHRELEDIAIRVATQGGFARGEEGRVGQMVADLARRNRVGVGQAGTAVEQLISSGFKAQEVLAEGGSGDAFVRMLHAINASGRDQDPRSLALAVSKFLTGTGQQLNAQSVQGLATPLFNLFQGTNIQAQHLENLGPVAASLRNRGMSPNEQLAVFSSLVDIMEPSVAATGMSSLTARLAASGQSKEVMRGLGQLGLKPGDVDMAGESFLDVLDRIRGGAGKLNPAQQAGAFRLIAGQEHLKTLENLVLTADTSRTRLGLLGATGQYSDAVARRLEGLGAAEREVEARGYSTMTEEGALRRENELFRERLRQRAAERGVPGLARSIQDMQDDVTQFFSPSLMNRVLRDRAVKIQLELPNGTRVRGDVKATDGLPQ